MKTKARSFIIEIGKYECLLFLRNSHINFWIIIFFLNDASTTSAPLTDYKRIGGSAVGGSIG